ncbi:unnamed protein product [Kuraishia capsulata CBS 1993]|uniref:candidapepsin n=1 Tax=Kuraishia capsulata CBS 1993 TaxID=1382522 RepID=W6MT16_9ASCO|nr:uncharacterized protein KUCA_T00005966001 [Kuraishia capsulata CBS 1993]CDK29971.1 unnamed protein product [Kuraishia capsulata CBS 1993]
MKFLSCIAAFAFVDLSVAQKVVKHNFDILRGSSFEKAQKYQTPQFVKRDDDEYEFFINNMETYYQMNISVGTPGQDMAVLLDTGSSDLWLYDSAAKYCSKLATSTSSVATASTDLLYGATPSDFINPKFDNCGGIGGFDSDKSSTFHRNKTEFLIKYGDNTTAEGYWGRDLVTIGDTKISNLTFAVAAFTNSTPVFGIGLPGAETTFGEYFIASENYTYENLPAKMATEGLINTPAYSLFLNDVDEDVGSVLFGGVDHSKYSGNLTTVKVVDWDGGLQVTVSEIDIQKGDKVAAFAQGKYLALLDSGTTLTYLPNELYETFQEFTNATWDDNIEQYYYDCDEIADTTISFDFTGAKIEVPLKSFTFKQFGKCVSGIQRYDYDDVTYFILGDNFLRNAYVVYDLENLEISLAQAKYNGGKEDVEEITKKGVPSAVKAKYYSDTYIIGEHDVTDATSLLYHSATPVVSATTTSSNSKATGTASSSSASSSSKGSASSNSLSSSLLVSVFGLLSMLSFA